MHQELIYNPITGPNILQTLPEGSLQTQCFFFSHLIKSVLQLPLQINVQNALKRLEEVHEMFEKRHISLKRLSAKQTRPVQPVAPRPESSPKRPSPKSVRPTGSGKQVQEVSMKSFIYSTTVAVIPQTGTLVSENHMMI